VSAAGNVKALATPTILAESTAQVLIALDSLGVSVYHPDFVKNNVTTYDALLQSFALKDGAGNVTGFSHTEGGEFNLMASEQGMLALVSHALALKGLRLFDFTGTSLAAYKALGAGSPQTSDEMPMQIYLALAVASLIIMSGAVLVIRRQRKLER
jgi:ABC-type cobalamin transport system ATPase subunit